MPNTDVYEITDERLDSMETADLRAVCDEMELSYYSTKVEVASFVIDATMVRMTGTLAALDNTIAQLLDAYADRGAEVTGDGYGARFVVRVWQEDFSLRSAIRAENERRRRAAEAKSDD